MQADVTVMTQGNPVSQNKAQIGALVPAVDVVRVKVFRGAATLACAAVSVFDRLAPLTRFSRAAQLLFWRGDTTLPVIIARSVLPGTTLSASVRTALASGVVRRLPVVWRVHLFSPAIEAPGVFAVRAAGIIAKTVARLPLIAFGTPLQACGYVASVLLKGNAQTPSGDLVGPFFAAHETPPNIGVAHSISIARAQPLYLRRAEREAATGTLFEAAT